MRADASATGGAWDETLRRTDEGTAAGGRATDAGLRAQPVDIDADGALLRGDLVVPPAARGIVVFAHGSGSSRLSPRNRFVALTLAQSGLGTLLFDLLTADEERIDERTMEFRFDIVRLSRRLEAVIDWLTRDERTSSLRIGCFGASTGAAAALVAAAERPAAVRAVVSRGGRPDLTGPALARVRAPTLLIVGARDRSVLELNRDAARRMTVAPQVEIVQGATHLFEEPGALERVADLARDWFLLHLGA